jgi:branched-chain amino acid transport system permease protein
VNPATQAAIQIVIGGLLQGSLFALVALGFALVFRMTGVINLSQGAFCVLGALLCWSLEETLHLPVPLAILGAVLLALLLGLAIGKAVFVPALARLPNSGMLMLTAGLLTFIQGLMLVWWGGDPYALRPLTGEAPVHLLGVRVPSQGFWIAGTAAIVIAAFWYLFARTTLGKALQASAENPTAARLMGIDVERMAVMSFGLAAGIGALGGIVLAPILAVQFDTSQFFTISGFISVAIGGMGSFVGAVVGGLVLGVAEQLAAGYISGLFSNALALGLLLLTLLFRPSGLFPIGRARRSDVRDELHVHPAIVRLRGRGAAMLGIGTLAVILVLPLFVRDPGLMGSLVITGILFIGVLGLDVLMGFAGQVSLGQGGFMAIGGYVAAILATTYGWPPLAGIAIGCAASLVCALLLSLATMRLRGHYLALATLAFGLVVDSLDVGMMDTTGGPSGLVGIPSFEVAGIDFGSDRAMYYLVVGIIVALVLALIGGMRGSFGRALMAIRADRLAAGALGINVARLKLAAFAISAVLASLAGSLYAFYFHYLSPEMVGTQRSFEMITMLVIGGEGTLVGPLLGVGLLTLLPTLVQSLALYKILAEGLLLVLAFSFLPEGMFGGLARLAERLRTPTATPLEAGREAP